MIGGGGMARCVLDVIDAVNSYAPVFEVVGVLSDKPGDLSQIEARGIAFLGGVVNIHDLPADVGYVIGLGDGRVRREIDADLQRTGRECPTIVHPNAHRGFDVQLGPGSVVCSHVSMENNIRLGRHAHVNQNATVGHDTRLADYVTVSPLASISGNVTAGEAAFFGAGSAVREHTRVGADSVVGMGATVVRDVPAGVTVVGTPARAHDGSS